MAQWLGARGCSSRRLRAHLLAHNHLVLGTQWLPLTSVATKQQPYTQTRQILKRKREQQQQQHLKIIVAREDRPYNIIVAKFSKQKNKVKTVGEIQQLIHRGRNIKMT